MEATLPGLVFQSTKKLEQATEASKQRKKSFWSRHNSFLNFLLREVHKRKKKVKKRKLHGERAKVKAVSLLAWCVACFRAESNKRQQDKMEQREQDAKEEPKVKRVSVAERRKSFMELSKQEDPEKQVRHVRSRSVYGEPLKRKLEEERKLEESQKQRTRSPSPSKRILIGGPLKKKTEEEERLKKEAEDEKKRQTASARALEVSQRIKKNTRTRSGAWRTSARQTSCGG